MSGYGCAQGWLADILSAAPSIIRTIRLAEVVFVLPFSCGFFCRTVANLLDMTFWPFLLVFNLAPIKIIRDPAVHDLVAEFE